MASNLHNANFRIYGIGNFDVSILEVGKILELLDTDKDGSLLNDFYEELHSKRMG